MCFRYSSAAAELELERQKEAKMFGTVAAKTRLKLLAGVKARSIQMFCTALFGILVLLVQLQVSWNGIEMEENSLETVLSFDTFWQK